MNEKKNIDKLFKEQLKEFEVAPKDHVWKNIEQKLHEDGRKKRRIIPIWWRFAGVAAGLILLFTVADQLFNTSEPHNISNDSIVNDSNTNDNTEVQEKSKVIEQDNPVKEILQSNVEEDIVDTNSKASVEDEQLPLNKNKSNTIVSENKVNSVIVSENSTKENTQNSNLSNSGDFKKLQEEKRSAIEKPSTKDVLANTSNNSSKSNQNTNNKVENQSEINPLLKSNETITDSNLKHTNPINQSAVVSNTNTEQTSQDVKSTTKETSKTDELQRSNQTDSKSSVAYVAKEKQSETEQKVVEETQNKEKEQEVNAIENAIAEVEDIKEEEEEEENSNRWSVSPNVAPVYFSSFGDGSPLDNQFIENTKETEINMSYGLNGSYAVNKKLKIRAGINKVQLGYQTNDVLIFENTNPVATANRQIANVNLTDSMSQHSIYSARNFKFDNAPATLFTQELGSLDQQLGFIEVPIELEYNVIERKIGLNLIGGFSALFLSDNDVYAVLNNGDRTRLGEASNIKDLSYTANFGIGLDYNFSKQFQFNLEPTFKYQINTFNNTSGNFNPFFIGVYTGLSFKF